MNPTPILDGLVFPESPRWHGGELWFSDMLARRVIRLDPSGRSVVVAELDDQPSGLGFLPDGTPLVVLMDRRQIARLEGGDLTIHADLRHYRSTYLNDMVVGGAGRAYVGSVVRDAAGEDARLDRLFVVEPDGASHIATTDVHAPNGLALTADGGTLIVAETPRHRLAAFPVSREGGLGASRLFADLGAARPDGICLDEEGAIWVGCLEAGEFRRVLPGGQISARVPVTGRWAIACVIGGQDRRSLYLCTAETSYGRHEYARGFIEVVRVDVPGAGWP